MPVGASARGPRLYDATGRRVAAEGGRSKLVPGATVGVWYVCDDVWHERLVLGKTRPNFWQVLTPDGDNSEEDLDGSSGEMSSKAFLCSDAGSAPALARGAFYRFRDYPGGPGDQGPLQGSEGSGGEGR